MICSIWVKVQAPKIECRKECTENLHPQYSLGSIYSAVMLWSFWSFSVLSFRCLDPALSICIYWALCYLLSYIKQEMTKRFVCKQLSKLKEMRWMNFSTLPRNFLKIKFWRNQDFLWFKIILLYKQEFNGTKLIILRDPNTLGSE